MSYDKYIVMKDMSFHINPGEIFLIIGGSGCGKSTLLKYLLGLKFTRPGHIFYDTKDINSIIGDNGFYGQRIGVLYQSGALWSSMTVKENVALPLEMHTSLSTDEIDDIVQLKLSSVGLKGFGDLYPAQLSGGMRKRAGLARAMALDPEILFFDEPSAGLDPISSRRLDDLILELKESLGMTVVIVTHELASIFGIGTNAIYLDSQTKTISAYGPPKQLATETGTNVAKFLSRSV